jgi:hypothetical protein
MPDSLFLLKLPDGEESSKSLTEMRQAPFENEDIFQGLLAEFPKLLSNHSFGEGEPRRWALVSREKSVPDREGAGGRWSLDHLFLDQDGVPSLVEVKRSSDTRARREVVAQMLDYAANAVTYWTIEDLREAFERNCRERGDDPETALGELCQNADLESDEYWRSVEANLRSGRIRMLFVADYIAPELLRIVEFLNEQMRPATVLAVEIKQFLSGDQRLLSPTVLGQTTKAQATKAVGSARAHLSEDEWLQAYAERNGPAARRITDGLLCWFRETADDVALTKAQSSIYVACRSSSGGGKLRYPMGVGVNGTLFLGLGWIGRVPGFEEPENRKEIIERFSAIPGVVLSTENTNGFPSFPISVLQRDDSMEAFKREAAWLIGICRG